MKIRPKYSEHEAFNHNSKKMMKKFVEMTEETFAGLVSGKCVKGSLRRDDVTGRVVFRAYRQSEPQPDRVIRQLEHGWLKESARRYKFFNSVKKEIGRRMVDVTIHRELKAAMTALEIEEILDNI